MKTKILLITLLCLSLAACGGRRREQATEVPNPPAAATAVIAPTEAPAASPTAAQPATEAPTATLVVQPTEVVQPTTAVQPTEAPTQAAPTATVAAQNEADPQGDSLEAQLDQLVNQNATDESNVNNLNP